MRKHLWLIGLIATAFGFTGCTKSEPDNAVTRYAQDLAQAEGKAQDAADKANAVIARTQQQANKTANQEQP